MKGRRTLNTSRFGPPILTSPWRRGGVYATADPRLSLFSSFTFLFFPFSGSTSRARAGAQHRMRFTPNAQESLSLRYEIVLLLRLSSAASVVYDVAGLLMMRFTVDCVSV